MRRIDCLLLHRQVVIKASNTQFSSMLALSDTNKDMTHFARSEGNITFYIAKLLTFAHLIIRTGNCNTLRTKNLNHAF